MRVIPSLALGIMLLGCATPDAVSSEASDLEMWESLVSIRTGASGSDNCDRRLAAEWNTEFEKRFGRRIEAVHAVLLERYGDQVDKERIMVSSCRTYSSRPRTSFFVTILEALEKRLINTPERER